MCARVFSSMPQSSNGGGSSSSSSPLASLPPGWSKLSADTSPVTGETTSSTPQQQLLTTSSVVLPPCASAPTLWLRGSQATPGAASGRVQRQEQQSQSLADLGPSQERCRPLAMLNRASPAASPPSSLLSSSSVDAQRVHTADSSLQSLKPSTVPAKSLGDSVNSPICVFALQGVPLPKGCAAAKRWAGSNPLPVERLLWESGGSPILRSAATLPGEVRGGSKRTLLKYSEDDPCRDSNRNRDWEDDLQDTQDFGRDSDIDERRVVVPAVRGGVSPNSWKRSLNRAGRLATDYNSRMRALTSL
mmetsp:Transcript_36899/g.78277  ORF Transcript_36899/g.78277 Transcript_36899/m.78277 type:complete len:303 (-) Transcript_36899:126-1034(-)